MAIEVSTMDFEGIDTHAMIETGWLIPANSIERGKVYIKVPAHEPTCPIVNGGDICNCREVAKEIYEFLPNGPISAN